jgi:uncharacterized protein (TIGR00255 family)
MRSMTGYGRGETTGHGFRFVFELQAFNRKHLDIVLTLPRPLYPLESRVRERIQSVASRGRVQAGCTVLPEGGQAAAGVIDLPLARLYAESMRQLQRELGLEGGLGIDTVIRAPGVLLAPGQDLDPDAIWPTLEDALRQALNGVLSMREAEGAALAQDLASRIASLRECASEVRVRIPEVAALHRRQLLERLRVAEVDLAADPDRLLRELALFADRSDISEELTRLESHFQQFEKLLGQSGALGRTLEFLTQEIARELNTLSVKSNDVSVSHWVVGAKTELEKIREQVQNIE